MQLGRIKIEVGDSKIKLGDIVRLRKPFKPERSGSQEYTFAVVVGVIADGSRRSKNRQSFLDSKQTAQAYQPQLDELVVYLYQLDSSTIYIDKYGVKALYSFSSDEVELYKAI